MKSIITVVTVAALTFAQSAWADDSQPTATDEPAQEKWAFGHQLNAADIPQNWLQGNPVTEFKKDTVYLIDFWQCPKSGPRAYMFERRRPGFHGTRVLNELARQGQELKNVEQLSIAVQETSTPERIKKFLNLPVLKCDHPVANDGEKGTIYSTWMLPCGFESFPYFLIVKNGVMLWSGEGSSIPGKLITQAADADFHLKAYQETKKNDGALYKTMRAGLDKIYEASENGASVDELNKMIDAEEKRIGHIPFCFMTLQELRHGFALKNKDNAGAIAVMKRAADTWPNETFVQGRVFKYLGSAEDLKPESCSLIIQCMKRQAVLKDGEYASRCWLVIADAYNDMGETEKATEAFKKAVAISTVQKRLDLLQSGGTLPIAE